MALDYKILGQQLVSYTTETITVPPTPGTSGYGYYGSNIGDQGGTSTAEYFLPVTIYTVPAGKSTIVTSMFIANQSPTETTYDLAIVKSGESLSLKHHIRWDYPIAGNNFDNITSKITMSAGDSIVIFPSTVDTVSITAFGVEQ